MQPFSAGQRYISSTEIELGLGIVSRVEDRHVTITFPAASEKRIYAMDSTPLSRIVFDVGDNVVHRDGDQIVITEVNKSQPLITYTGISTQGQLNEFSELELADQIQLNNPVDKLFNNQLNSIASFQLRQKTLNYMDRLMNSDVAGLCGPRVQLLSHQVYIAHEVSSRLRPRVLLADEVGLGKTIEACLILHRLILLGRVHRALILVPQNLLHQWLVELLRRFNLSAVLFGAEHFDQATETDSENPFDSAQLALTSLELLENHHLMFECAYAAHWDIMIVDEAHRIHWQPHNPKDLYLHIESLARKITGLLLLTATPEQLGRESHFARLRLIDPERFHSLKQFYDDESRYVNVASLIERILNQPMPDDISMAKNLLPDTADLKILDDHPSDVAAQLIARRLLDYYGTGRIFYRNTRHNIQGFPRRQLQDHRLTAPDEYLQQSGNMPSVQHLLQPEWQLGKNWLSLDPRVKWLTQWLRKHPAEKFLLICANSKTACDLENYLSLSSGTRSAAFHEDQSLIARDRAAAYFSERDGAQILLCSEIGSEGRNFQFCHHLILFDLPLNPDVLEQRIGRIDRIGQEQDITIHVPYYENTAMETLLRWYNEALNSFSAIAPAALIVHEKFAQQLQENLQTTSIESIELFLNEASDCNRHTLGQLNKGRNRLIEFNSLDQSASEKLIDDIYQLSHYAELRKYAESLLDYFGYEIEDHDSQNIIIRPGNQMTSQPYPYIHEEGITATFQREIALVREDLHYLSWEHPLLQACMSAMLTEQYGSTTMCMLKLKPLPAGSIMIESIFNLMSQSPKRLALQRFLQPTMLRLVVDEKENILSHILKAEHIDALSSPIKHNVCVNIIKSIRERLSSQISFAETLAASRQKELIELAIKNADELYGREYSRLESMTQKNTNITKAELDALKLVWKESIGYLKKARLQLDSLRICIITQE